MKISGSSGWARTAAATLAVLAMAAMATSDGIAASIAIYRGAALTMVPAAAPADGAAVRVVRGPAVKPTTPRRPPAAGPTRLMAGTRLWIVDPARERLRVCVMDHSTQVGQRVIRCATRALPD